MGTGSSFWSGRSLLELVAMTLVAGLVASIAVPSLGTNYQEQTFDLLAKKALAEVTEAQKHHFQIYKSFIPCDEKSCASKLTRMDYVPLGVVLKVETDDAGFTASAFHIQGTGQEYKLKGSAG